VKIEHDLGCARLTGIQRNPADLIEPRADLTSAAGFFICAQPAVPIRTAAAMSRFKKDLFFIVSVSEK